MILINVLQLKLIFNKIVSNILRNLRHENKVNPELDVFNFFTISKCSPT